MRLKLKQQQTGVSLIEVLVAMLILAVGLLGFAGLQTQAIKINYDALQRARASAMAEDLFDRMRANSVIALNSNRYLRSFGDPVTVAVTNCRQTSCSAYDLANWDMARWFTQMMQQSPGADAAVTRDNRFIQVTIRLVETSIVAVNDSSGSDLSDSELLNRQQIDFTFSTIL